MTGRPDRLYHFTCGHGRRQLGRYNALLAPYPHPLLRCRVIWLTTEATPDREATGLTNSLTSCDRMAYRYIVTDIARCRPWIGSPERSAAPDILADLETFGDPEHWWIADRPVRCELDISYCTVSVPS